MRAGKSDRSVSKTETPLSKGQHTRARIISAAAPVFNRKGFSGSSLSDLMHATGLTKGGLYRHFRDKEDLATAAFDLTWSESWRTRTASIDPHSPALAQLEQFIANFVELRSPIPGGCPVLNTAIESDDGGLPALRDRAREALRFWLSTLEAIVRRGRRKRELRPDAEPSAIAAVITASLEGALMMSRLTRSPAPLLHIQQHLNQFLRNEVALHDS